MLNGFARISALVNTAAGDDLGDVLRLREKGGKHHDLPLNTNARAYLNASGIREQKKNRCSAPSIAGAHSPTGRCIATTLGPW